MPAITFSERNKRFFRRIAALTATCLVLLFVIFKSSDVSNSDLSLPKPAEDSHAKLALAKEEELDFWQRPHVADKRDWHNYDLIKAESKLNGPGEHGSPYHLSPDDEKRKDSLYKVNGFNALVSDRIALNRSVRDIRHPDCKKKLYLKELPTASLIVPFHNEHFSVLLRTVYSSLNRAPENLIEVILVDDASTKGSQRSFGQPLFEPSNANRVSVARKDVRKDVARKEYMNIGVHLQPTHCKQPLDDYVRKHLPKVRVLHLAERSGLIRARAAGIRIAKGEVIIIFDAHSECNVNWLPPLLEPIAMNYRTVVCPFVDVLDMETFEYRAQDEGARGAFDWELFYKRLPLLPDDLKHPSEPFKSPVMAGGYFAMSAKFFNELGGYDEGLEIWGGEQYELSFKIWQCGGEMVDTPCSRIGHIYRKYAPFPNNAKGDFVGRNYKRVAEVWMDEYKEYLYNRRPQYRNLNPGDLTVQLAARERLHCKPFKWFMKEVAFDLPRKYPPVEPPDFATGEVRSVADSTLCVDTQFKQENERFHLALCATDHPGQSAEQQFALTWHKDVRPQKRGVCWDVSGSEARAPVLLWNCHGSQGNQLWRYIPDKQWLVHGGNPRCLDCDPARKELFVSTCNENADTQKWVFEHFNRTALLLFDSSGPDI